MELLLEAIRKTFSSVDQQASVHFVVLGEPWASPLATERDPQTPGGRRALTWLGGEHPLPWGGETPHFSYSESDIDSTLHQRNAESTYTGHW